MLRTDRRTRGGGEKAQGKTNALCPAANSALASKTTLVAKVWKIKEEKKKEHPSPSALSQLFEKIDNDEEWFPGKCDREKYGPAPVINGSNQAIIARSAMIMKEKGEPSYPQLVAANPKATLNPKAERCYGAHCLRKRWRKLPPEPSKTQPGGTQIAPKSTPEAPMRAQMRPRAPKRRPKGAQERPRDAQERPKPAQERPRRVQDRPWRAPNASKNEPGEVQDAFWARLSQTAWFERLPKRFFAIFRVVRVACDMCSDPIKLWFCHIQSVRTVQAHTHAKASKNRRPEAPKPTRNPLKLSPEPLKSHRRTQESAFKSSKTQKSSLKARMCAQ